jgi:hypothetical protein
MRRITLKVQSLGGPIWASDDAFKRAMRIRDRQAVMDVSAATIGVILSLSTTFMLHALHGSLS